MRLGARRLAAGLALGVLLGACSSGEEPVAEPSPTPTVEPSPTPTPPDTVALTRDVQVLSLADDDVLTKRTGRDPIDEVAVMATADELADLVRAHLDDLNAGRDGLLADLVASELLLLEPDLADLLREGLADATTFATEVDLAMRIGADGAARWAEVDVDVLRIDGTRVRVDLVLSLDGDAFEVVLVSLPDQEA